MRSSFSRSAIVLLLASAVALFALSVLLHAYGDGDGDDDPVSVRGRFLNHTYSVSALGHAGLFDVLKRLDRPVFRSLGDTLAMVGPSGTLIVAEPDLWRVSNDDGLKLLGAHRLLLVLPKWTGVQDDERPAWVSMIHPAPQDAARNTLALIDRTGDVLRTDWPEKWTVNDLAFAPSGDGIIQLIRSPKMRPIVGTDEGMLVGEIVNKGRKIWVLSDPDILSNYGVNKGDNAALMVNLIDALRLWRNADDGAPIVFDETMHGFRAAQKSPGSPIKLLFQFPVSVVTLLTCLAAFLLALAGTSRFGAPQTPPPELDFGKKGLIDNSARLLNYGGHHGAILKRYIAITVHAVAHTLHAPPNMDVAGLGVWLDRIGNARGVAISCATIMDAVIDLDANDPKNLPRLLENARDIHRWKGEILNGSATRRNHR